MPSCSRVPATGLAGGSGADRAGERRQPLAVLELAASETGVFDGLVTIPAHIEHTFAARVHALPAETRAALLIAAVDDLGSIDVIGRATPLAALGPAEDAGLVRIVDQPEFRHPLVRSAIYHGAAPTDRRAAHAALAAALPRSRPRGVSGTPPRLWSSRTRASPTHWSRSRSTLRADGSRGGGNGVAPRRRAHTREQRARPTAAGCEPGGVGERGERRHSNPPTPL